MPEQIDNALFNRLLEGELSPQDADALVDWLGSENPDPATAALIMQHLQKDIPAEAVTPDIIARLQQRLPNILAQQPKEADQKPVVAMRWWRYAAAAVIILLIGGAAYLLLPTKQLPKQEIVKNTVQKKDIDPGRMGAILTLDNGKSVVLDSMGNGLVASQNGSNAVLINGKLVYNTGSAAATGISYNTMTTPKGRQFQMVLPDGTKVWLNAASSLRYPVAFAGNERKVEITGEVYFEVAKNAAMPFRVMINKETSVEVLGTHFNINAYANESSINTTLLEGSVKVTGGNNKAMLKPGQQARINNAATNAAAIEVLSDVNTDKVVAWKDGVFNFQDAKLHEVMRQLERWYDIDVVYEKDVPEMEFVGKMGRDLSLSAVLRGLKNSKVHYRVEGRKLVISN
ncbi:MAG: DUF4974 domain-containing protein [Chitinophagaceae bacterium]